MFRLLIALPVLASAASFACAQEKKPAIPGIDKADDGVTRAILSGARPPRDIFEVRQRLLELKGTLRTHVLANRGHENPHFGSFSFFETYEGPGVGGDVGEGDLFFGFFTSADAKGDLFVIQSFREGSLLIELIAWDYKKKVFNFWELVGAGGGSQWRLAGDSLDILADNREVHLTKPPRFGGKLRCAACHTQGGLVMKELDEPHNDWARPGRPPFLGKLTTKPGDDPLDPYQLAGKLMQKPVDAASFSKLVRKGNEKLIKSLAERDRKTDLRETLRALFTTMEMNLITDAAPLKERLAKKEPLLIPVAFFIDPRLTGEQKPITMEPNAYEQTLKKAEAVFAKGETPGLVDSHHAFSVPARSHIDNLILDRLSADGILDEELIADVLAVDFTTPVYSPARAGLLAYVPREAKNAKDLREKLIEALEKSPAEDKPAQELLANLKDEKRNAAWHRERGLAYLQTLRKLGGDPEAVLGWYRIASQRRKELRAAPTSRHPLGQVAEPDFKILFPEDNLDSQPGHWLVDPKTGRPRPALAR